MTTSATATTSDATSSRHSSSLKRSATTTTTKAMAEDVTRRMICGGLAGMIAKTATNPLERIKMLSQTGDQGHRVSVWQLYRSILQKEGVLGLWAGNGANLVRVFPAKAVVFSSNDFYRQLLGQWPMFRSTTSNQGKLSGVGSFLSGGLAGMSASMATYPLDFARGRISGKLAVERGQKAYGGIVSTLALTIKDEGFLAIYKGITPTLLGAMPYEGIKFGTVGVLEVMFPRDSSSNQLSTQQATLRKMLFGGLGGLMAGLITYPNDTVRRLLQLQGSRGTVHQFDGYWDCVRQTVQQHGVRRLYAGLGINLVRMAPNTAVQFGSYELLKQWTAQYLQ